MAGQVIPAVAATPLPTDAAEAGAAGVVFDGFPGVNGAFMDGMHVGLWVAAALAAVVAVLVMIAVREPKHHSAGTVMVETVEGAAGHL